MRKWIWKAKVFNVDMLKATLTVWRKKHEAGKNTYFLTTFLVPKDIKIKNVNASFIKLSDIKPGHAVTIDYIKERTGGLIASAIILADKIS